MTTNKKAKKAVRKLAQKAGKSYQATFQSLAPRRDDLETLLAELDAEASTGLDMSPGSGLAARAAEMIRQMTEVKPPTLAIHLDGAPGWTPTTTRILVNGNPVPLLDRFAFAAMKDEVLPKLHFRFGHTARPEHPDEIKKIFPWAEASQTPSPTTYFTGQGDPVDPSPIGGFEKEKDHQALGLGESKKKEPRSWLEAYKPDLPQAIDLHTVVKLSDLDLSRLAFTKAQTDPRKTVWERSWATEEEVLAILEKTEYKSVPYDEELDLDLDLSGSTYKPSPAPRPRIQFEDLSTMAQQTVHDFRARIREEIKRGAHIAYEGEIYLVFGEKDDRWLIELAGILDGMLVARGASFIEVRLVSCYAWQEQMWVKHGKKQSTFVG